MNNRHPSLPKSGGLNYVVENVYRALRDLCLTDVPYGERILNACRNAHRPNDNEFFTAYMSDQTLTYWRECSVLRFDKRVDELTEAEIADLAESLMAYLHAMSRDKGIVLMGGDPREFEPYTGEEDDDDNPTKPVRNNAEA